MVIGDVSATPAADLEQRSGLRERVRALGPWFHNMRVGGVETAPDHFLGDYPAVKFAGFKDAIPADLTGKTVLDIGCNAGFYSLEMKRRGASRVVGIDSEPFYLRQARFVAEMEGVEIEYREMPVWDVAALREKFDLVIYMGVFYHLRYPLLALDLIREHVCKDLLLFQSMQRGSRELMRVEPDYDFDDVAAFDRPEYPKMHFVEERYSGDDSNWWVPNRACAEAMLRSSGFKILSRPEEEVYLCQVAPTALFRDAAELVRRT